MTSPSGIVPGWYPDPDDQISERYWDGQYWRTRRPRHSHGVITGALVVMSVYALVSVVLTWLPSYFEEGLGYSRLQSGSMFAFPSIVGLVLMVLSSITSDRMISKGATSRMLRIVVLAFAYAVAFLVLRAGMISALTVFKNLYIAAGCAALIGAFIVMPNFLKAYVDPLKKRGVINPDALKAQTSVPAPVVAPQPASVAQSQPAPVKKVVRRVIKKGNPDA